MLGFKNNVEDVLTPYRRMALKLHYDLSEKADSRSILLAPPARLEKYDEGGVLLACCMAEKMQRPILLIDLGIKARKVTNLLDDGKLPGLSDVVSDKSVTLKEAVHQTSCKHLYFLPAGTRDDVTVSPDKMADLLATAEKYFNFIVLTGAPVLGESTALSVAPHVGSVLLTVIENRTKVNDLQSAQEALMQCHAKRVGVVMTKPAKGNFKRAFSQFTKVNGTH